MSNNTTLWDKLGKTDPAHTKGFTRGGGFKGTAIKPMWSYRRMTEEFGPCGTGWGIDAPQFQVLAGAEDEKLVFCTVTVWYRHGDDGERHQLVGVGGDKAVGKNKYGLASDDEAFKKSFTDAVTNALKLIGVGADVHMGMFDDSKYVAEVRREYEQEQTPAVPVRSSASLKRDGEWDKLIGDVRQDLLDCKSIAGLSRLRSDYRERAKASGWPKAWLEALKNEFDQHEDSLPTEDAPTRPGQNSYADNFMAG